MGSDLSANYSSITLLFSSGFWKVRSAVSKVTGEVVSLWMLDDSQFPNEDRARRETYISSCIYSVQQIRKLHHPGTLKIHECNESTRQLAFVAEPYASCLAQETSLTSDEVEYVADQLANVLTFLHFSAKIAHLNVSPNSVFCHRI
jgi:hypothetical protein